jgi:magnesium chelatase subunit H
MSADIRLPAQELVMVSASHHLHDHPRLALALQGAARALSRRVARIGAWCGRETAVIMHRCFLPVLPALTARRDKCDAMICAMSAGEVMRLTRMGKFTMDGKASGPMALLKRLRGNNKPGEGSKPGMAGAKQMKIVRQLPKILRFIPGTAQDLRNYFLVLQYWLAGSDENITSMIGMLLDNYADGPRRSLRGIYKVQPPV